MKPVARVALQVIALAVGVALVVHVARWLIPLMQSTAIDEADPDRPGALAGGLFARSGLTGSAGGWPRPYLSMVEIESARTDKNAKRGERSSWTGGSKCKPFSMGLTLAIPVCSDCNDIPASNPFLPHGLN